MKKIFIAVLAVAALASCSKEQTVNVDKGAAIGFDTFVENSTRANDLVKGAFDFGVFGLVEKGNNSALIFNNQTVNANGGYSPAQYWIAAAQYYFTAIAPKTTPANATWSYATTNAHSGTITFDNSAAAANQDLLFAYNKPAQTPTQITAQPDAVAFTFNHMLSRVRFTFANGFGQGSNITLQVTDVTITDAYATAQLAVADGTPAAAWTNFGATFSKNFGQVGDDTLATLTDTGNTMSASTEHFYLIPANKTYNVTFTVKLFQAGVELDTYNRTATIPAIPDTGMQKGMSYDIKTTLTAQNTSDDGELWPIEFTVDTVTGWENFGDGDITGTVN
jgi:hypothetical protein